MNYQDFQEAKVSFRLKAIQRSRKPYYRLRNDFVRDFTPRKIASMKIDEYVIGKGPENHSFCYGIERTLDPLGRILGATSSKFGVYYSSKKSAYLFAKKYGDNYKDAFKNIREYLVELLDAGKKEDYDAIIANPISTMLKGKILSTYYPELYLNIFSEDHLNHYLVALDLDSEELLSLDPIYKRMALVDFKNKDKDMRKWSLDMFSYFLCFHYPKAPKEADDTSAINSGEEDIDFPTTDSYEYVDLEISTDSSTKKIPSKSFGTQSPNYEKEAKKYKKLGDRGEKIVMKAEIERVKEELHLSQKSAEKKVFWKSRESDSFGYDILSINQDGSPRYIEVKATQGSVGDMDFFYTLNELETAQKYGKHYYIYIVYDILSMNPKIWRIHNPFIKDQMTLIPIQFRVEVKTK